jgi:hypothetical protein
MSEQVDFASIFKAFAEERGYKHLHIIMYNDDFTFDSISLLHQNGKTIFSKEDAEKILAVLRQDYTDIAMEYGYLKAFNC